MDKLQDRLQVCILIAEQQTIGLSHPGVMTVNILFTSWFEFPQVNKKVKIVPKKEKLQFDITQVEGKGIWWCGG